MWLLVSAFVVAQQPAAPRPRVLAFFTAGGELDHVLFAQQAMRALAAGAGDGGYAFAATTEWDDLNDANLRDVRLVIWLNDMPRTPAQRQAFERYMTGGGAWLGFHVSGFGNNAWPWFTEFMGGSRFSRQQLAVAARARQRRRRRASDREGRAADVRGADQRVVLVDAEPARQS